MLRFSSTERWQVDFASFLLVVQRTSLQLAASVYSKLRTEGLRYLSIENVCSLFAHFTALSNSQSVTGKLFTACYVNLKAFWPRTGQQLNAITSLFLKSKCNYFKPAAWKLTEHVRVSEHQRKKFCTINKNACRVYFQLANYLMSDASREDKFQHLTTTFDDA